MKWNKSKKIIFWQIEKKSTKTRWISKPSKIKLKGEKHWTDLQKAVGLKQ